MTERTDTVIMDECHVVHCGKAAAIILPTICEDVALCVDHARGIAEVQIPRQRAAEQDTVTRQ